jgi:hypothetical protein
MIGGDFNLIQDARDKNNDNINWPRIHCFNDVIVAISLREIPHAGERYTWTNLQLNPISRILDMVFMSPA